MAGKLCTFGRRIAASAFLGNALAASGDALKLRLVTSAADPGVDATQSSFVEATFGGYAEASTIYGDMTGPTREGDDQVVLIGGAPFVWDCTSAPQTIYGWYLFDEPNGEVVGYDLYATPHVLQVGSRHTLYAELAIGQCP